MRTRAVSLDTGLTQSNIASMSELPPLRWPLIAFLSGLAIVALGGVLFTPGVGS